MEKSIKRIHCGGHRVLSAVTAAWTTHRHPGIHCFASGRHTLSFRTENPSTPPSHPSANQSRLLPGIIQGNPRKPCNHIDRTRHQLCKRPNCMARGNKNPHHMRYKQSSNRNISAKRLLLPLCHVCNQSCPMNADCIPSSIAISPSLPLES
jgi:hypothetical protein